MKALIINNKIATRFQEVPKFLKAYKNVQRPDLLSEKELAAHGINIVEVDEPVFDQEVEELQNKRFDPDLNRVVFDVVDLPIDIEAERTKKHKEFENILYSEMPPALVYAVIEKLALGLPVPRELIGTLTTLRAREVKVKAQIDAITDAKEMKKYKFEETETEKGKMGLTATRKL